MPTKFLFVYILKCSDGIYYTGLTNNPEKRLIEHNSGINPESYTFTRRPVEMVYCEKFTDYDHAVAWEKRIKDWSRKKKEALINDNLDKLIEYASCKNETSHKKVGSEKLLDSARSNNSDSPDVETTDSLSGVENNADNSSGVENNTKSLR